MRAAFYESDITPPLGGNMPGYYGANPALDVYERLYAKALVVEDGGKYIAILALDTCESDDACNAVITDRIFTYTGIPAESVCIHTVHTHKGAPVEHLPHIGQTADLTYRDVYVRLAADAVILAYKRLENASAFFGIANATGLAYNRDYVLKDGSYRSFSAPPELFSHMLDGTDDELPVLVFKSEGKPIGAVISFACHGDCATDIQGYTGDYSSVMAKKLKERYGPDFVSLFMIGTAGDINHIPTDPTVKLPPLWYREMGIRLAKQAACAIEQATPTGEGVGVIKEQVTAQLRVLTNEECEAQVAKWEATGDRIRAGNLKHYHQTNRKTENELTVQVMRIGDTCLYAYPGEIFVAFGKEIKARSPFANNIVTENNNSYCGYIPTEKAFAKGSDLYEISLCYGSRHTPKTGKQLTEKLLTMAAALQDSHPQQKTESEETT